MKGQILAAAAAALLFAGPAAASVTVGDGVETNCLPFGCLIGSNPSTRYQQVYDAGAFPGSITIVGLAFDVIDGDGSLVPGVFDFRLSTSNAGLTTLDLVNFGNNVGIDNTLVFSGTLPALAGNQLTINFSTPFTYDPAQGNLLLDVSRTAGGTNFIGTFFLAANGSSTVTSRATNFGLGSTGFGLNTTFITPNNAVPEPASWAMLIAGFGLVGAAARRRRALAA